MKEYYGSFSSSPTQGGQAKFGAARQCDYALRTFGIRNRWKKDRCDLGNRKASTGGKVAQFRKFLGVIYVGRHEHLLDHYIRPKRLSHQADPLDEDRARFPAVAYGSGEFKFRIVPACDSFLCVHQTKMVSAASE